MWLTPAADWWDLPKIVFQSKKPLILKALIILGQQNLWTGALTSHKDVTPPQNRPHSDPGCLDISAETSVWWWDCPHFCEKKHAQTPNAVNGFWCRCAAGIITHFSFIYFPLYVHALLCKSTSSDLQGDLQTRAETGKGNTVSLMCCMWPLLPRLKLFFL